MLNMIMKIKTIHSALWMATTGKNKWQYREESKVGSILTEIAFSSAKRTEKKNNRKIFKALEKMNRAAGN